MFKASVEVKDPGLIQAHIQILEKAPEVARVLIDRTVNKERDRLLAQFRREPGPSASPVQWESDKQRKAFFASDGFGHGIPYRRRSAPNRMVDQWRLIVVYQPGRLTSIMLENNDPARRFVTGHDQQKFHLVTGWYQEEPIIQRSQRLLTTKVETDLIKSFYAIEER